MNFSDLNFQPHPSAAAVGVQARHFFDNGYGISVVMFRGIAGGGYYGYEEGMYESAVLKGTEENWNICYDTPITSDVIGHQTEEEVEVLLHDVENL